MSSKPAAIIVLSTLARAAARPSTSAPQRTTSESTVPEQPPPAYEPHDHHCCCNCYCHEEASLIEPKSEDHPRNNEKRKQRSPASEGFRCLVGLGTLVGFIFGVRASVKHDQEKARVKAAVSNSPSSVDAAFSSNMWAPMYVQSVETPPEPAATSLPT